MRAVRISKPASDELVHAVHGYETRRLGLGGEFFDAVSNLLATIEANPEIGRVTRADPQTRRALVRRFPYQIDGLLRDTRDADEDCPEPGRLLPRARGGGRRVPRISEFFGIAIYMYWLDRQKHGAPHFHARFAGDEAVFDLDGNCLEGNLGPRATRLVGEWCQERRAALGDAWAAAVAGREIPWVAPLR